jgi:hypothetical protein
VRNLTAVASVLCLLAGLLEKSLESPTLSMLFSILMEITVSANSAD